MKKKTEKNFVYGLFLAAVAMTALLSFGSTNTFALRIEYDNGVNQYSITDNDQNDKNPAEGIIDFSVISSEGLIDATLPENITISNGMINTNVTLTRTHSINVGTFRHSITVEGTPKLLDDITDVQLHMDAIYYSLQNEIDDSFISLEGFLNSDSLGTISAKIEGETSPHDFKRDLVILIEEPPTPGQEDTLKFKVNVQTSEPDDELESGESFYISASAPVSKKLVDVQAKYQGNFTPSGQETYEFFEFKAQGAVDGEGDGFFSKGIAEDVMIHFNHRVPGITGQVSSRWLVPKEYWEQKGNGWVAEKAVFELYDPYKGFVEDKRITIEEVEFKLNISGAEGEIWQLAAESIGKSTQIAGGVWTELGGAKELVIKIGDYIGFSSSAKMAKDHDPLI